MKTQKTISEDRTVTLEIEIPIEDVSEKFAEALKVFQQQSTIPGFRPGRVPMDLIRRRWGKDILSETAEAIAKENLSKALEQEKLEPAGRIDLEMVEYGEGKALTFKVKFPLQPEVKLSEYKNLKITMNTAEISDEDINRQLEGLQEQNMVMKSVDTPATPESVLTIKIQEVDPSGLPLIGKEVKEEKVEFGLDQLGMGSDEQLLGVKAGEVRVIRTRTAPGNLTAKASLIVTPDQIRQEGGTNRENHYRVEVEKVEIPELPAIDSEFIKQVNADLNSIDDLRNWIKQNLSQYIVAGKRRWLEVALRNKVIEVNPFPIARSIIETVVDEVVEERKLEGDERKKFIETEMYHAEVDFRWMMLMDEIGQTEDIKVTDEDTDQELQEIADRTGYSIEKIKDSFKDEETINQLRRRIFERKVIDFLAVNAEIEERVMEFNDFLRATPYVQ